jgi:hypothetical protein
VSTVALLLSGINAFAYYYTNLYKHRNLFLTVTPPPEVIEGSTGPAGTPFDLNPVIQNIGNYTEVIINVSYGVKHDGSEHTLHQAGPYVLKAGDAIAVPLSFPFDLLAWFAQNLHVEHYDTFLHVSILGQDEKPLTIDIPVAVIYLRGYSEHDHMVFVDFGERISPNYKNGPSNLISAFRWFKGF